MLNVWNVHLPLAQMRYEVNISYILVKDEILYVGWIWSFTTPQAWRVMFHPTHAVLSHHLTNQTWIRRWIRVFPKIWMPQNGLFIMEKPINMDDLGGAIIFGNTHITNHPLFPIGNASNQTSRWFPWCNFRRYTVDEEIIAKHQHDVVHPTMLPSSRSSIHSASSKKGLPHHSPHLPMC